jgi:hypothetical protein
MPIDKSTRRMTLRQLLTHTEKYSRDLIELAQASLVCELSEFRDLSRPVRRRSHYPTLVAMQNALRKLTQTANQIMGMSEQLQELLTEINSQAKRERANRV